MEKLSKFNYSGTIQKIFQETIDGRFENERNTSIILTSMKFIYSNKHFDRQLM